MTTIKATCPSCGEIDLGAGDIILRIGGHESTNSYGFSCPLCADFIEKPADERIVRLLLSGGVMPQMMRIPAEALEPKEGPPISYDDLLAFHEALKSEDWLDQLMGPHAH